MMGKRPDWAVFSTTDDGKTVHLSINAETRQLFLAVSDSGRPPEHVATFNGKTRALDNFIDGLIEGHDLVDDQPAAANEQLVPPEPPQPTDLVVDLGGVALENKFLVCRAPGEQIAFMRLPAFISVADAIALAAWILALADPANEKYPAVRAALEQGAPA